MSGVILGDMLYCNGSTSCVEGVIDGAVNI